MVFEGLSHTISFLMGVAVGASGKYLADKFTDQRRKQESQKATIKQFKGVKESMSKLISEMKEDLCNEESKFVREFCIIGKRAVPFSSGEHFVYYFEDHEDLQSKIKVLENCGYIMDITPGNLKRYRMTEEFVDLVQKY